MSKFNVKTKINNKTENLAGGQAYKMSSEIEIISFMATTFIKDTFYRSEDQTIAKLEELFNGCKDKEFFAKSAVYTRNEFGMRSVTHITAAMIANNVKGEQWTKNFFKAVFRRPDDVTETLSYYIQRYGKPIPNSLKKGIRMSFGKYNDYQIAKYKSEGKSVKMVDVLNITHPKPIEQNKESFKMLIDGNLKNTETWESLLSKAGTEENKDEAKADVWNKLLMEKKLGYFALLRNLNNINKQNPRIINEALKQLVDPKSIKSSLVLPFRFLTAYKTLEKGDRTQNILSAIDTAATISLDNVPNFTGDTVIFLDQSGSMSGDPIQKASMFAATLCKKLKCDVVGFSETAHFVNYNPNDSILTLADKFEKDCAFGGTDFKVPFRLITTPKGKSYSRIIILSDMQGWVDYNAPKQEYNEYCKSKGKPFVYSWDLAGYGTLQLPQDKVICMAGWSDKVFTLMSFMESDKDKMIKVIKETKFE